MSCRNCDSMRQDGYTPPCESGSCAVPGLSPREARIVRARSMLISLRGMADAASVFGAMGIGALELEVIARVEDALTEDMKGAAS